jgi:hypothetical protein
MSEIRFNGVASDWKNKSTEGQAGSFVDARCLGKEPLGEESGFLTSCIHSLNEIKKWNEGGFWISEISLAWFYIKTNTFLRPPTYPSRGNDQRAFLI